MRDAEAMLRELGTPATMCTATAESLERIARERGTPVHQVNDAAAIALCDVGRSSCATTAPPSTCSKTSASRSQPAASCVGRPQWSGKSTILNMIAGLLEPSSGAIAFADGSTKRPRLDVGYLDAERDAPAVARRAAQRRAAARGAPGVSRRRRARPAPRRSCSWSVSRTPAKLSARAFRRHVAPGIARAHAGQRSGHAAARRAVRRPRRAVARGIAKRTADAGKAAARRSSSSPTISTRRCCWPTA